MAKRDPSKPIVEYPFQLGDRVKIRYYDGPPGRIYELRGALGPGGALIYRILLRRKPAPAFIEVRGDQMELAPPPDPARPKKRRRARPGADGDRGNLPTGDIGGIAPSETSEGPSKG